MAKEMETLKDEGLQGNETIEEAILGLQKEPTPELLAHVLTVIRRTIMLDHTLLSIIIGEENAGH